LKPLVEEVAAKVIDGEAILIKLAAGSVTAWTRRALYCGN
jgi:hypothetical protein